MLTRILGSSDFWTFMAFGAAWRMTHGLYPDSLGESAVSVAFLAWLVWRLWQLYRPRRRVSDKGL